MPGWLLQSTPLTSAADTLQSGTQAIAVSPKEMHLWDILVSGGPIMVPLALLLVAAIFFMVERWIAIKRASKIDENFMGIIRDHIMNGKIAGQEYQQSHSADDL